MRPPCAFTNPGWRTLLRTRVGQGSQPPGPVLLCLAEWALPCLNLSWLIYKMGKTTCSLRATKINMNVKHFCHL